MLAWVPWIVSSWGYTKLDSFEGRTSVNRKKKRKEITFDARWKCELSQKWLNPKWALGRAIPCKKKDTKVIWLETISRHEHYAYWLPDTRNDVLRHPMRSHREDDIGSKGKCMIVKMGFGLSVPPSSSLFTSTSTGRHRRFKCETSCKLKDIGWFIKSFSITVKKRCTKKWRWPSRKMKTLYVNNTNMVFVFAK